MVKVSLTEQERFPIYEATAYKEGDEDLGVDKFPDVAPERLAVWDRIDTEYRAMQEELRHLWNKTPCGS